MHFFSYPLRLVVALAVSILLTNCANQNNKNEALDALADTTVKSETIAEATEVNHEEPGNREFIRFNGTTDDEVRKQLESFPAFDQVYQLTSRYVAFQDSLEAVRNLWGGQPFTDPKDTTMIFPYKQKAYQAILNYKKQMISGVTSQKELPTLLDLTRIPEEGDSSLQILPPAGPSDLLTAGNFFFLGGAPFLSKLSSRDDTNFFTDEHGKPETRFGLSLQDNASYLLNSISHAKHPAIEITSGVPLYSYEMGQVEVHGIGSLTHNFVGRIPAFFITEEGLVPAKLISVQLKLAPDYDCGSGPAYIELACATSVEEKSILGIYIPYETSPASSTFSRPSNNVWTADLNSDGVDDFACVTNSYMGDMDYVIMESLWYANINGTWQIIDWAEMPECT
jgi:hypothetical protein